MAASRGFGGRLLWVAETTEGTTPTDPAYKKFSDHVQSVSLSFDPANEEWRDIGDYDVASFVLGLPSYKLRVSYLLHTGRKDMVDDAVNRQADNSLKSYSVEVAANRDDSTVGYYTFKGCKPEEVVVRGEVGKPTMVEVTYSALDVSRVTAEPSVGTGSRESAALGALTVFSTSTIRRGAAAVAFITRSASFRVSHALEATGTDGQVNPKAQFEGPRQVSGSMDISVDDGGVALADAVLAGTEATVDFNLGSTGAPKYSITAARWENFDLPLDKEAGFIKQNVPFRGKTVTTGTVA